MELQFTHNQFHNPPYLVSPGHYVKEYLSLITYNRKNKRIPTNSNKNKKKLYLSFILIPSFTYDKPVKVYHVSGIQQKHKYNELKQ